MRAQPLLEGTQVGPYVIAGPLGSGGMGVVYRARDTRLGREVAIKVLPARLAADEDRLHRFEREARAVSQLAHPNIVVIHDVGTHEGSSFIVTELLRGETLRQRLNAGPLPVRDAVEMAIQVASGLGAAHRQGIVHRDLKPENLFVGQDGLVKILDFGLAKLMQLPGQPDGDGALPTASVHTQTGILVGTPGYIAPEQLRGIPVDLRSDVFALGTVLYEMLSGERAFRGPSQVETLNAILKEEPPSLSALNPEIPPDLARIVQRCLDKDPDLRYQSAGDLAEELRRLRLPSSPFAARKATLAALRRRLKPPRWALRLLPLPALGLGLGIGYLVGLGGAGTPHPGFQPLTFRRGTVRQARFGPDRGTVVYDAAWDGGPVELYWGRAESVEARTLGVRAGLLDVSATGELAILMEPRSQGIFITSIAGTLARVPLAGGAARAVVDGVAWAVWGSGEALAVVRDSGAKDRLEYPADTVLFETPGWISNPRVAPDGEKVAFIEHPVRGDDGGWVSVVERGGRARRLSGRWLSVYGLAWEPRGEEIWFTATQSGSARALHAVSLAGRERLLVRAPGPLTLHDVAPEGRALLSRDTLRGGIVVRGAGDLSERDLSWFDASVPIDLTPDGRLLLFNESGEGGGPGYGVYVRVTDGSAPAVRLGSGAATALSRDGRHVLSIRRGAQGERVVILPSGTGREQVLEPGPIVSFRWATYFPGDARILIAGNERDRGVRLYAQDLAGGAPRPIGPEGIGVMGWNSVSPDGRFVAARGGDGSLVLLPVDGGAPAPVAGILADESPIVWSEDGGSLFVLASGDLPARVYRVEVATGRREMWREIVPSDPAGITGRLGIVMTPDGATVCYGYYRLLSQLFAVKGIR